MTRTALAALAAGLLLTGCSNLPPLSKEPKVPSATPMPTATSQSESEDDGEPEPREAAPVVLSNCVKPTKGEAKRVAAVVQALGYGGTITRTAAVRFGDYAVVATYITNSETAPGYPKADRKATWRVSTNANGRVAATEVADAWHNISDEVQTPGRKAQKRALGCIN